MKDIVTLQEKQKKTEDSLLTLMNELDIDSHEEPYIYNPMDKEFEEFDKLMESIAHILKTNDIIKSEKNSIIPDKLFESVAKVMKKKVEEQRNKELEELVEKLSMSVFITGSRIAGETIVVDPDTLDLRIQTDVGQIPNSILGEYEDTLTAFTKKNEFLIIKGSFGYQILKQNRGYYNHEEMLCKLLIDYI